MKDIENRQDIQEMVNSFYKNVRKDLRLSYLFDDVAHLDWESHLPIMYDFWESMLFENTVFNGNPMDKHIALHHKEALQKEDFDLWLKIFKANIDLQFSGLISEKAKQRAESIATLTKIKTVYS